MKKLDMMGKTCPIPVIEAKKILGDNEVDAVSVEVDNKVATNNLSRLADSIGAEATININGENHYNVVITKGKDSNKILSKSENSEDDASEDQKIITDDLVVIIGSNKMGEGAEDLGKILMKGFIYSLSQLDAPPSHILFLNSGAFLTSEGANTVEDLKTLEERGTIIHTCGTCANYYDITEKLAVGSIIDMYGITNISTQAKKTLVY